MVKKIVHPQKPRLNFRTVLLVIAPSAILLVGSWLTGAAAFVFSENPFEPNVVIMFGGFAVIVTVALLVAVFSLNRTKERAPGSDDPPSLE
jgi:cytochrome c-type biogenesis protein CcmH/NrfF